MAELVISEAADGIVTLTLNAPEMRNPISDPPMIDAIIAAVTAADRAPDTRVIIITGAGSAFSSGGNINAMRAGGTFADPLPARTRYNYQRGIQRIPLVLDAVETPLIAAVNGPAIGAGCDLALMCDIRVAGRSAKFAESFVKLGLIPGDGGAWLLQRVIGYAKASEMSLTGDTLDAEQALACGLVSSVVDDEQLMPAAQAIARRIAANPPHAVRMTKRLMKEARAASLPALLELSAAMQSLAHATADHHEAVEAFIARRSPDFTGN